MYLLSNQIMPWSTVKTNLPYIKWEHVRGNRDGQADRQKDEHDNKTAIHYHRQKHTTCMFVYRVINKVPKWIIVWISWISKKIQNTWSENL